MRKYDLLVAFDTLLGSCTRFLEGIDGETAKKSLLDLRDFDQKDVSFWQIRKHVSFSPMVHANRAEGYARIGGMLCE